MSNEKGFYKQVLTDPIHIVLLEVQLLAIANNTSFPDDYFIQNKKRIESELGFELGMDNVPSFTKAMKEVLHNTKKAG